MEDDASRTPLLEPSINGGATAPVYRTSEVTSEPRPVEPQAGRPGDAPPPRQPEPGRDPRGHPDPRVQPDPRGQPEFYGHPGQYGDPRGPPPDPRYYNAPYQQQHPYYQQQGGYQPFAPPRPPRPQYRPPEPRKDPELTGPTPAAKAADLREESWSHVYNHHKHMVQISDGHITVTHVAPDSKYSAAATSLTRVTHMTANTLTEVMIENKGCCRKVQECFMRGCIPCRSRAGASMWTMILGFQLIAICIMLIFSTQYRIFQIFPACWCLTVTSFFTCWHILNLTRRYVSMCAASGYFFILVVLLGAFVSGCLVLSTMVGGKPSEQSLNGECSTPTFEAQFFACATPYTTPVCENIPVIDLCDPVLLPAYRSFAILIGSALLFVALVHCMSASHNLGPQDVDIKVPSDPRLVQITFHAHRGSGFPQHVILPEKHYDEIRVALASKLWPMERAHLLPRPAEKYWEERCYDTATVALDKTTRATSQCFKHVSSPFFFESVRSVVRDRPDVSEYHDGPAGVRAGMGSQLPQTEMLAEDPWTRFQNPI